MAGIDLSQYRGPPRRYDPESDSMLEEGSPESLEAQRTMALGVGRIGNFVRGLLGEREAPSEVEDPKYRRRPGLPFVNQQQEDYAADDLLNLGSVPAAVNNLALRRALSARSGSLLSDPPTKLEDFVNIGDFRRRYADQYLRGRTLGSASEVPGGLGSRTMPSSLSLPEGTWVIDDMRGAHGREIGQVVRVDPMSVNPGEVTPMDRMDDAARYAEWRRKGLDEPPINVVEARSSARPYPGNDSYTVTDGHRRRIAAMEEPWMEGGRGVKAILWPDAPAPLTEPVPSVRRALDAEQIARFDRTQPPRLWDPPVKMRVRVTLRDGTSGTYEVGGVDEADILKRAAWEYPGAYRLEALGYAPGGSYTNIVKRPTSREPANPLRVGLTAEMLPDIYDWRFYRGEQRGVPPEGVRMQVRHRPDDRFIGIESFPRERGQGGLDPGLSYLGPQVEKRPWTARLAYEHFNIHDDHLHPSMTFVNENMKRKGINTAAMDIAEEILGRPVHPSTIQSDEAKEFWKERLTRFRTREEAQKALEEYLRAPRW